MDYVTARNSRLPEAAGPNRLLRLAASCTLSGRLTLFDRCRNINLAAARGAVKKQRGIITIRCHVEQQIDELSVERNYRSFFLQLVSYHAVPINV